MATDLEAYRDTFDVACSHEVIYLVEDIAAHARAVHAALKAGGVYYAAIGCHAGNPGWPRWQGLVQSVSSLPVHGRTLDEYADAFRSAGFAVYARHFRVEEFVPLLPGDYFATVADALDYYDTVKTLFRLVKRG